MTTVALVASGNLHAEVIKGAETVEAAAFETEESQPALRKLVDESFLALYARFEQSRARYGAVQHIQNPLRSEVNRSFTHLQRFITPEDAQVTTPNNDTLYSAGWAELSQGPVQVYLPEMPADRYWSMALMDIDTNNFALLGSSSGTQTPTKLVLVPPGWSGELQDEVARVDVPGNDIQILVRVLVSSEEDLPLVSKIQAEITMQPYVRNDLVPRQQQVIPRTPHDPANFLAVVNESLVRNPFPSKHREKIEDWRAVGIGVAAPSFEQLPRGVQSLWQERIPILIQGLHIGLGCGARLINGWRVPDPDIGHFKDDDRLRASVAHGALGALVSSEAIYLQMDTDPVTGEPLDGSRQWELVIPEIDTRGFWSITLYRYDEEGRLFFVPNRLDRYSIGDRTAGLTRDQNGQLRILLQSEAPTDTALWLPTPPGRFALVMRVYLPSHAMREGTAPLPVLSRVHSPL